MARKVRLMQSRTAIRRAQTWQQTCALLLAGAAVLLPLRQARAAMNFCAAPALQTSERTNADPGVKALVNNVQAHLNDPPRALAKLHTEGTLPHEG
ncbi:alginate lyase, partial [Paraburkholderia sp. SIMBA_027]